MKEATAVKGARQFIQLLDWGAGEVVERGGFFLTIIFFFFFFLSRGCMAEWWWEIQEERKSLGGTSRVEEETQINEV